MSPPVLLPQISTQAQSKRSQSQIVQQDVHADATEENPVLNYVLHVHGARLKARRSVLASSVAAIPQLPTAEKLSGDVSHPRRAVAA